MKIPSADINVSNMVDNDSPGSVRVTVKDNIFLRLLVSQLDSSKKFMGISNSQYSLDSSQVERVPSINEAVKVL